MNAPLRKQTEPVSKILQIEEMNADMHDINLSKYIWQQSNYRCVNLLLLFYIVVCILSLLPTCTSSLYVQVLLTAK